MSLFQKTQLQATAEEDQGRQHSAPWGLEGISDQTEQGGLVVHSKEGQSGAIHWPEHL